MPDSSPNGRADTGVLGLDDILHGGLPMHRLYLLQGEPGVGKTTLAMQFLMAGARRGEKGLYITLSETREEIDVVAQSHGWDLSNVSLFELATLADQIQSTTESTFFHPSEVELNRTMDALVAKVEEINPTRLVFDSLSELRLLSESPLRYRRQVLSLKRYFAGKNITVLFLDDRSGDNADQHVQSIAHGVLTLRRSLPAFGIARRQIAVEKLRGSAFNEGNHDFVLRRGGMTIFPRLVPEEGAPTFEAGCAPSGNEGLDALLGGGLDRGTSTMFMGPPGTAKSTLAIRFALAAAERGEKSLFFIFDENINTILARATALGMDLRPHLQNGLINVRQVDPAEISPGELAQGIRKAVRTEDVRLVIIDSINGYLNAMPEERYLTLQLHELLAYLAQAGVVTILVLAQQGLVGTMQSAVDLTYLADTVVLSRFFEARGAVKLALSIIKKRSGNHERTIREYRVTQRGIDLGEPLHGMQGVLTGVPTFLTGSGSLLPPVVPKHPEDMTGQP